MKKLLGFVAVIAGSLLFMSNVSAQTLKLPYDEYYTDGTTVSLGTATVEMSDDLTLKTTGAEGTGVTLDYWYEYDGGTVLEGYDYGLYLTAFVPTKEEIEAPFPATITMILPSKFDQKDFKIVYGGKDLEVTHNADGSITFVAMVGTDFGGAFSSYMNLFEGFIFLKDAEKSSSTESPSTGSPSTENSTTGGALTNKVESKIDVKLGEDEGRVDFELPDDAKVVVTTEKNVIVKVYDSSYESTTKSMFLMGSMELTVSVDVQGYTEETLPVNISLPIPSNYDTEATTLKLVDGTIIEPTSAEEGVATFTTYLSQAVWNKEQYWTNHARVVFKKAAGNTSGNTSEDAEESTSNGTSDNTVENASGSTLGADSSAAVATTIETTNALPEGAALSVKAVEIAPALKTAETHLKKVFDISVLDMAGAVIEVKNNKMTITMDLDEELKDFNTYEVVYIKDGKVIERMPATVKNGRISFTTTHLSEYGIVAYNAAQGGGEETPETSTENTPASSSEKNPETLDNISWFAALGSVSLIGLLSAGLYLKKENELK